MQTHFVQGSKGKLVLHTDCDLTHYISGSKDGGVWKIDCKSHARMVEILKSVEFSDIVDLLPFEKVERRR